MSRITGRVEVLVNGTPLLTKSGAVASGIGLSGEPNFENTPVIGENGINGVMETPVAAQVEVTITDREDISLDTLARIKENGTVIFRAARGGKNYTMNNATCSSNFGITSGEGDTTVVFFGPYWTESVD
jgi:hypothetical protein